MLALLLLALTPAEHGFLDRLAQAALQRTQAPHVTYDPAYVRLAYPGGDVRPDRGVCADVVVRSYRALGIDLQREVHEDMAADFAAYPKLWKLKKPDTNIDHRRVPNLRVFFTRHGVSLPVSSDKAAFLPGDIVTLTVAERLPHIAIVSAKRSASGVPLVVHNIGAGEVLEDALFTYPMTGHYRYFGK
jgi:uncharacterized protein YijF (DUF1287 family)